MAEVNNEMVRAIVQRVLSELGEEPVSSGRVSSARVPERPSRSAIPGRTNRSAPGRSAAIPSAGGVFDDMGEAVEATTLAQRIWADTPLSLKAAVIQALRDAMHQHAEEFARMARAETGMGRVEDKILKHHNAATATPGLEDLDSRAFSGDRGLVVEEYAPYGVVGAVTPSTHPIPVLLNSIIIIIAPGNGAVFNVHPAAKRVSSHAMEIFHRAITAAGGPPNLVSMVREPTLETLRILFGHPSVSLIAATGGPAVVEAAFQSGKKVIAAGPGNPPVLVDETACLHRASEQIIRGAGFDNNILCIAEKETFVVASVFDRFMGAMEKAGAVRLNRLQIRSLTEKAFIRAGDRWEVNRDLVGKNAAVLAKAAGLLTLTDDVRLLFGETEFDHPFVQEEQMMPFMPLVRVGDVREGIDLAVKAERGYGHTAMIHSNHLDSITAFCRALNTSIVVVNGSSLAGNGPPAGEGYFSHTIASPTGEGVCTPRNFARIRRICSYRSLRIV
jgi:acyl-CoA reductase-like NAD-dependent aldehyde dehydrogenase